MVWERPLKARVAVDLPVPADALVLAHPRCTNGFGPTVQCIGVAQIGTSLAGSVTKVCHPLLDNKAGLL